MEHKSGGGRSKKERKEDESYVDLYKAELPHDVWHDSIAPKHVA
jgi:hypothetical protein